MKQQPMILLGGTILLLMSSTWISGVLAGVRTPGQPLTSNAPPLDYPLNRNCVVTVDPLSSPKPEIAGKANKITGFVAPDTVEGVLVRLDADWLVLRDACNENWIPQNKVILIHVCD
jgi:hypothetical protein